MTTAEAVSATASVLEEMTSSIMTRKKAGATQLTPVGSEARAPKALPSVPGAMFPDDQPAEAILQRLLAIEEQVGFIVAAIANVRELLGQPTAPVVTDMQKARERAADEAARQRQKATAPADSEEAYDAALAADLAASVAAVSPSPGMKALVEDSEAALRAGAQAVLAHMDLKAAEAQAATFGTPDDGWACPKHGQHKVETTRKGRKYRVCPVTGCGEFEHL